MKKVWIASDCIVSPLGSTTLENYQNLLQGKSGIDRIDDSTLSAQPFYGAKVEVKVNPDLTKFESLCCQAIEQVLGTLNIRGDRTLFILSTTKGNITFLEEGKPDHPRIHLHAAAKFLSSRFGFSKSLVVSNACISGVMALLVAKRMIDTGAYDHAVVVGADVLSRFVISGFQSLQAFSPEPCRPFDSDRKGISLGECAAAIVLTSNPGELGVEPTVWIAGGGLSNDANHISGPSRTGDELGFAVQQAMKEAGVTTSDIDFISAHGTATVYNDEMEAKAFSALRMSDIPLNSLKGYFGHTLGAAGVAEVAINAKSLFHDELIPSKGFSTLGVSQPVNVITAVKKTPLHICLKTASGFGGCNAAIILKKEQ